MFTLLVKKSSAAPDPGLNQQAASSAYASNSSTSGAPPAPLVQRNSDTAKPQETIGFRDGSLAHVVVVGVLTWLACLSCSYDPFVRCMVSPSSHGKRLLRVTQAQKHG